MTTHSLTGPGLRTLLAASILFLCSGAAVAQERFSLFVPSAQPTVERLVKLARIQENDVVVDLGSGDGRIVLTAARDNPKVRGWGVDINENLVRQSNEAAKKQGVSDRVQFFHRNVFDADIRDVTVINMWLF
ncbi:MAG: methyltransferase domain-containing protein, partial [Rhodocyclaceae bacterium]|nr:methyltransferase domain-containing protein [Rhodocyclaceae bacterium]